MMPEGSGSGRLTLYRATQFPLAWEEERVLVPRPLVDASLVEWQGRWYLLASDLAQPGAVKNGERRGQGTAAPLSRCCLRVHVCCGSDPMLSTLEHCPTPALPPPLLLQQAGNLNVWHAASPLGPWEPHPSNPVANGPRALGFRNGGRLVVHGGRLYRFGQDCGQTYGHKVGAAGGHWWLWWGGVLDGVPTCDCLARIA